MIAGGAANPRPKPKQRTTADSHRQRWTPVKKHVRASGDQPRWTPVKSLTRISHHHRPHWKPGSSAAPIRDPATRKLAHRNHMDRAGARHGTGPKRPGRGWLYEFYAAMGRLDIYYRLFPGG
jgi:hypothetical protein